MHFRARTYRGERSSRYIIDRHRLFVIKERQDSWNNQYSAAAQMTMLGGRCYQCGEKGHIAGEGDFTSAICSKHGRYRLGFNKNQPYYDPEDFFRLESSGEIEAGLVDVTMESHSLTQESDYRLVKIPEAAFLKYKIPVTKIIEDNSIKLLEKSGNYALPKWQLHHYFGVPPHVLYHMSHEDTIMAIRKKRHKIESMVMFILCLSHEHVMSMSMTKLLEVLPPTCVDEFQYTAGDCQEI